jgi:O-antigen/teichoic acid export membrane protein/SAM-dependent methyltransferase
MQTSSFRKLAINTISLSVGRWISQILNVIFVPVALAYISPGDYGTFSIFQVAALIGGVVMSLGISTAFISQFGNSSNDSSNLLGRMIGQQVIFGCALLMLALALCNPLTTWLANGQPKLLLPLFFFGEYFANIVLIINRWQILTNRHWQLSVGAISKSIGQFILLFIFVIWKHYGLLGLVISDLGSKIVSLLVVFSLSRNVWKLEFRKADIKTVVRLGMPAAPDTIFFWLLIFLPLYLMRQHGFLVLAGAFSLGWRLLSPVDLLGNSLASAAADKILDKKSNQLSLNRWHRLSVFAITFSMLSFLFFAKDILHLFFKPDYYQILALLPVMAAGVLFLSFYYFEWISISGSIKTYGLSIASGGGVLVLIIGVFLVQNLINGLSLTILFSLSFFTMWLIARGLNSGKKLGYSPFLVISILLTIITGYIVTIFSTSVLVGLIKFLILGSIALVAGIAEYFIRSHENKTLKHPPSSFLEIPNYAEIAKMVSKTSPLLDIGCSEGFFLGDMKISGLKVGVEIDFNRLKAGRLERNEVNFVCADASYLPFCRNSFETVVLIGVMPYLENPLDALMEVHRVLNNKGQVEISAASDHWFYRYLNIYNWKNKCHFYKSSELEDVLNNAGFDLKSIFARGCFIAPFLSNFFIIPNLIDRLAGNTHSVLGPCARWARTVTNPLIQWEYDHLRGVGYQIFASGIRND